MTVSILIPARGGSTRLPRKNLCRLGGKTLVEISILQGRLLFPDAEIFVSTDNKEIAAHAAGLCGALILWRPSYLATAETDTHDVIKYHLQNMRGEYICLLQPTNPFRDLAKIRAQISDFAQWDSLFSAYRHKGFIHAASPDPWPTRRRVRSQEQADLFKEDGAFYLFRAAGVSTAVDRIFGRVKIIDGMCAPDIDDAQDLASAELLFSNKFLTLEE